MNLERSIKADKSRRYRERKRSLGLREIRLWVPDTRNPEFLARLKRESEMLRNHPSEKDALDFIEAVVADNRGFYD